MPTSKVQLDEEFKKKYKITKIHRDFRGAQKHVYIVTMNGLKCALKIFSNFNARDIRELKIYDNFKHIKDIPKTLKIEKYEDDVIVVEKYIIGNNLEDITKKYTGKHKIISILIKDLAIILNPFWNKNIIHRDIKPSNIIIKPNGKPVIIDFGIAKIIDGTSYTETDFQPHSWKFASPEQYAGKKDLISYRTDFFSLGTLCYFLYYQKLPFGNTKEDIRKKFLTEDNKLRGNIKIKTEHKCKLKNFFEKTLLISPSERPRSAKDFLKLLDI